MSYTNKPYAKDKDFRGPPWLNEEAMLAILEAAAGSHSVEELLDNAGLRDSIRPVAFERFRCRARHSEKDHALRVYIDLFDRHFAELPRGYLNVKQAAENAISRFNSACECGNRKEPADEQCRECAGLQAKHSKEMGQELQLSKNGH